MIAKERIQKIEGISQEAFNLMDFNTRTNAAWACLRNNCEHNKGLDGGFRYLCSNTKNSSNVAQDKDLNRRCALPWCPEANQVAIVASGKAQWIK